MEFWRYRRQSVTEPAIVSSEAAGPPDHRDAFAEGIRRGRKEERARRKGHPVLILLVLLVAVAGAAVIALAAREGSFSRGGQVVDQQLSVAADKAAVAGQKAAAQTGEALKTAGSKIEQKASDVTGQTR